MIDQLRLFAFPRELEPGEPHRCLDCHELDPRGSYGPNELDVMLLSDGSEYTINLRDVWFCADHGAARWKLYLAKQPQIPGRLRRLRAFRIAAAHGYRGDERFRVAEEWLRTNTVPQE